MAFHRQVTPGETFKPNASLSNDVRRIVNSFGKSGETPILATGSGNCSILVYNGSGQLVKAFSAIEVNDEPLYHGACVVRPASGTAEVWGVAAGDIAPEAFGNMIVSGVVRVAVSGAKAAYVAPAKDGAWAYSNNGTARVIHGGDAEAIIQLGAGGSNQQGPFALAFDAEQNLIYCSGGYINRNGEIVMVSPLYISPAEGYICVRCSLAGGKWNAPELKITATPAEGCYPVGYCTPHNGEVQLVKFQAVMPIIILTERCPVNVANS